jgi:ATP-dependent DNA helicase RecG
MCRTNDGFEIAEVDLQLRGPGDLSGVQQSGAMNLRIADLARDQQILQVAREAALTILESDPRLTAPEHAVLADYIREQERHRADWSRIS